MLGFGSTRRGRGVECKINMYFLGAIILSVIFTLVVKHLATKFSIVDRPTMPRKKHKKAMPLLGGVAIWAAFWVVTAILVFGTDLVGKNLSLAKLFWVFIGSTILIIVGVLDDKFSLNPKLRLVFTAFAVLVALAGGVGIEKITNPFGGIWYLDFWQIGLGALGTILVFADIIVFLWILGMTYTTKILDGLDGLTTGISAIGALMIFFIASGTRWHQADVALVALVFAGACLGFLLFNFNPAKIFLGESGSLFLGYMLGVLSVISGGKFATALLVMAVPILDLGYVIVARLHAGKAIAAGDRSHLHFRLVDASWSQRRTVLFLYAIAILFGLTTLFFQSQEKIIILLALLALTLVFERVVTAWKK